MKVEIFSGKFAGEIGTLEKDSPFGVWSSVLNEKGVFFVDKTFLRGVING